MQSFYRFRTALFRRRLRLPNPRADKTHEISHQTAPARCPAQANFLSASSERRGTALPLEKTAKEPRHGDIPVLVPVTSDDTLVADRRVSMVIRC